MSNRYKLPANKTLLTLDGKPTTDRKSWEHDRREYLQSLPGFEGLEPNGKRVQRRLWTNPKYAHGARSAVADQSDIADALELSRSCVSEQLGKSNPILGIEADEPERGRRERFLPNVYHLPGIDAPKWHRATRSGDTVGRHGGATALLLEEDGETETSLGLGRPRSEPSTPVNGRKPDPGLAPKTADTHVSANGSPRDFERELANLDDRRNQLDDQLGREPPGPPSKKARTIMAEMDALDEERDALLEELSDLHLIETYRHRTYEPKE